MPGAADETPRPIASVGGGLSEGVAAYEDGFEHLCKFIGLSESDFVRLKENEKVLHTIVDAISPQVYRHLMSFSHTRAGLRSRRQREDESLSGLIPERINKFAVYLKQLMSWPSHDMPGLQKLMFGMGMLHHKYVNVSLSHLVLSLGAAQNMVLSAVASDELIKEKADLLVALSKLLWLQADAFVTTYHQFHSFVPKRKMSPRTTAPIPETSDKNTATEDDEEEDDDDEDEEPTTAAPKDGGAL